MWHNSVLNVRIAGRALAAASLCFLALSNSEASYLDDIGYTALVSELQSSGTTVPNGTGVTVTQVEAAAGTTVVSGTTFYQYLPTAGAYSGMTFTNSGTTLGTVSWHADLVGNLLYGNSSMGNGISQVGIYYVNDWLFSSYLNAGAVAAPLVETHDVANHSWVGTTGNSTNDANILRRLDYSIERDDYVAAVGIQNSGTAPTPNLLSSAYNVISVGVTSGGHKAGTSSINAGVTYPHLVVPVSLTSEATAVVSSAAALLVQTGSSMGSAAAMRSETIKAVLLAGATKDEIPSWSHTSTTPLDTTYGAGELNIQLSHDILTSGEQTPSVNSSALVDLAGWDYNSISNQPVSYYFDLTVDGDISIALTWNAVYSGADFNNLSLSLANLNLSLYEVNANGSLGALVSQSIASTGNVEYIWATDLAAGNYVIQVNKASPGGSANYAVAWQAVPEPTIMGLAAFGLLAISLRRKRRSHCPLA